MAPFDRFPTPTPTPPKNHSSGSEEKSKESIWDIVLCTGGDWNGQRSICGLTAAEKQMCQVKTMTVAPL
ncbi:hypothetical protein CEXT_32871 [Caerostris extrusa]|uniref:Uncharacterized protein n=1 Tax=Caerostris extrusa TaxID=172846 RepID=A0AAV4SU61_CAEEX|nr:hypothetical protein CEXT_32871 [Caerostris extrusa]